MFIEHEGALYQGPARDLPQEVWSCRQMRFVPYQGETPKGVQWGRGQCQTKWLGRRFSPILRRRVDIGAVQPARHFLNLFENMLNAARNE